MMLYAVYAVYEGNVYVQHVQHVYHVYHVQEGFLRSTVMYLKDLSPYLDSSFLVVILRIQLELICWATTPPVVFYYSDLVDYSIPTYLAH
jgi:hypothetical protein